MNPLEKLSHRIIDAEESPVPRPERAITVPELIANPPLKETSLIYSIPIRGEWENGNVLRVLHAMFSQRVERGQAFEVEFVANDRDRHEDQYDEEYGLELSEAVKAAQDREARITKDVQAAIEFVKKVVLVQGIARQKTDQKIEQKNGTQLTKILEGTPDALQREVLQLAANQAKIVSVALIDATNMAVGSSEYKRPGIGFARTLGADMAMARFEGREDIALALFDADTVPENTSTVRHIQSLFSRMPNLSYVFFGMTDLPKGVSKDFASQIRTNRHLDYNRYYGHGSPQICFRLHAYKKLREIADFMMLGDEDRDTAIRLIYHFGRLQDGLLFEASGTFSPSSPTHLTADRLDGFVDGRGSRYKEGADYPLEGDLREILGFKEEILTKIESLIPEECERAQEVLRRARQEQEKRQRIQQRFNRVVVRSFLRATEERIIRLSGEGLEVDEERLVMLTGGKALRMYVRSNRSLIQEVLDSPQDRETMKYFVGLSPSLPQDIVELTPFQRALREYLGDFSSCADMEESGLYKVSVEGDSEHAKLQVKDKRTKESKVSFLHPMMAELLALGHTYRIFFQTKEFLATREDDRAYMHRWPKNPDEQVLDYHYGNLEDRIAKLEEGVAGLRAQGSETLLVPTPTHPSVSKKWWSDLSLNSFPIFELLKRLLK